MPKETKASSNAIAESPIVQAQPLPIIEPEIKAPVRPLIVLEAFGDFRRGNPICDPVLIEQILNSPQAQFVTFLGD